MQQFFLLSNRQINAVDGGMLLSKDINLINECKSLRKYGIDLSTYYQKNGQINLIPISKILVGQCFA